MPPFAAIERFFERLFERPSARLFRARLQPIQLQRRIERAMETERLASADRTLAPNRFAIHLHPDDLAGFGDMTSSLATELADGALVFARSRHYTLVDRPSVTIEPDAAVDRADIKVVARFADPIAGRERMVAPEPADATPPAGMASLKLARSNRQSPARKRVDRFGDVALFVNLHPEELASRWLVRPDDPLCSHGFPVYLEVTESAAFTLFRGAYSALIVIHNAVPMSSSGVRQQFL